mgnify:CR=1 FL=1
MILTETQTVKFKTNDEEFTHTFSLPKLDRVAMKQFADAAKRANGDQAKAQQLMMESGADGLEPIYDESIVSTTGYELETGKFSVKKHKHLIPIMHKIQSVSAIIADRFGGIEKN